MVEADSLVCATTEQPSIVDATFARGFYPPRRFVRHDY